MLTRSAVLVSTSILLLGACNRSPVEPVSERRSFAVVTDARQLSECRSVAYRFVARPIGPRRFLATITGDLTGTAVVQFDSTSRQDGQVTRGSAIVDWSVTDRTGAQLVFTTATQVWNRPANRPGTPATVLETTVKHRAVSGVRKAGLHEKGVVVVSSSVVVEADGRGKLCM